MAATQPPKSRATDEEKLALINKYSAFVFDLDGTIWTGSTLVPGTLDALDLLRYLGKKVFFVTNNSTLSRQGYLKKFQDKKLKAYAGEIYCSAYAAAQYLKNKKFKQKVYVIGESGIAEEMRLVGIEAVGGPDHSGKVVDFSSGDPHMEVDKKIGAVVVGLDRNINYYKIQYGLTCLLENKGCMFVATNTDARGNLSSSQEWAGAGTMVGAVIGSSEMEPVVVGKPSTFFMDSICKAAGLSYDQICVVGDRLDTDILWGNSHGCGTLLVLSGITSEEQLKSPDNKIYPTCYVDSVGDMLSVKDKLSSSCVIS